MAHVGWSLIKLAGINPERFALDWASAAEAPLYVELITQFTNLIKEMGPLGVAEGLPAAELKMRLSAAKSAAASIKLRTRFAKLTQELRLGQDYSPRLIGDKVTQKLGEVLLREMEKQKVGPQWH